MVILDMVTFQSIWTSYLTLHSKTISLKALSLIWNNLHFITKLNQPSIYTIILMRMIIFHLLMNKMFMWSPKLWKNGYMHNLDYKWTRKHTISTSWSINSRRGKRHFLHDIWSLYKYFISMSKRENLYIYIQCLRLCFLSR